MLVFLTKHRRFAASTIAQIDKSRWQIGVSSQGHINQPVEVRPRPTDSLVAGGGAVARKRAGEALRQHAQKGVCATPQVATCSERRRSLVTR